MTLCLTISLTAIIMHKPATANQMLSTITLNARVTLFIFNIEYTSAVLHLPIGESLVGNHSVAIYYAIGC